MENDQNHEEKVLAEACERLRTEITELDSFLGVCFGRSCSEYVNPGAEEIAYKDGQMIVEAHMNRFLLFDRYMILKPEGRDFVSGVMCVVKEKSISDVDEYMNKVLSILVEKYKIKPMVGDTKTGMFFYDGTTPDKKRFTASIMLYREDGNVVLRAFDKRSPYRAFELERLRRAQEDGAAREEALNAL